MANLCFLNYFEFERETLTAESDAVTNQNEALPSERVPVQSARVRGSSAGTIHTVTNSGV